MAYNSHLDNSESSAAEDRDDFMSLEEKNVQIFAKQMLQGRVFLGHFQERRRVAQLEAYRDVIVVSDSEPTLKQVMNLVRNRLKGYYNRNYWIGITDPQFIGAPNGHCFWVEKVHERFGQYWYEIKSVRFRRNEILIRLKVVRPMTDNDSQVQTQTMTNRDNDQNDVTLDVVFENFKNAISENVTWFLTEALTAQNIKQTITFLCILIATLATSALYGIQYLMEYFLKLMREISLFIQAATPVMISVVNLVGKVIGGLYILIAMLFKGNSPENQLNYPAVNYPRKQLRAIDMPRYRNREPLTIREIE